MEWDTWDKDVGVKGWMLMRWMTQVWHTNNNGHYQAAISGATWADYIHPIAYQDAVSMIIYGAHTCTTHASVRSLCEITAIRVYGPDNESSNFWIENTHIHALWTKEKKEAQTKLNMLSWVIFGGVQQHCCTVRWSRGHVSSKPEPRCTFHLSRQKRCCDPCSCRTSNHDHCAT